MIEINSTTLAGFRFVVIHLPIRAHRHLIKVDLSNIRMVRIGSIVAITRTIIPIYYYTDLDPVMHFLE